MARRKIFTVKVRRKRQGLTNYKKRLGLIKSGLTRMVVRRSNNLILLQLVNYAQQGDKVLLTVSSAELKEFGWNYSKKCIPAAYLTGLLLAQKASKFNVSEAIADIGFLRSLPGNKIYAAIKGAIDGGVHVHCDEGMFPSVERLRGQHISAYAEKNKEGFTGYAKLHINPLEIHKVFDVVKAKITG